MANGGNVPTDGGAEAAERLVVDFLNTIDVEDATDELTTEDELAAWADARGLSAGPLAEARALRDALRSIASGEEATLPVIPLRPRLAGQRIDFACPTAAEAVLASAVVLSVGGRLPRIKLCRADTCRVAFYDHSRNGSRTWCEMGVCGNREKARSYRARQA